MKKCISIGIIIVLILQLYSCGGSGSGNSNLTSKSVSSKLKGDFIFYEKNGSTYYTNCDDIGETKLSDDSASIIYLDEIRKK
jgi:hypothetical protein